MRNEWRLPTSLKGLRKFNRRRLSTKDFLELCIANGIIVKLLPMFEAGLYYCVNGKHYIALSTLVSREKREFTAWHEFAHFLQNFHRRETGAAFCDVVDDSGERLANAFATIATGNARITGPMDFIEMIMGIDRR